jgi:hypothetical protein
MKIFVDHALRLIEAIAASGPLAIEEWIFLAG